VEPKSATTPLEFLLFLLESAGLRNHVGDSAIPGLNREIALGLTVRIPADEAIRQFTEIARTLLALRAQVLEGAHATAEMRDTLLPKLMSGEIRVRDAEKVVEDVT
jgi:type I restriction enzyme S subunit